VSTGLLSGRENILSSPTSSSMVLCKIYVKNIAVAYVNGKTINPTYYIVFRIYNTCFILEE
jgi:hypothetical protein